jgi:hypothetical protein
MDRRDVLSLSAITALGALLPGNADAQQARPPLPPFTAESAAQKARLAEDAWNTRDPARVALAYTVDSIWRNRAEFIRGREAIEAFSHASGFASWSIG